LHNIKYEHLSRNKLEVLGGLSVFVSVVDRSNLVERTEFACSFAVMHLRAAVLGWRPEFVRDLVGHAQRHPAQLTLRQAAAVRISTFQPVRISSWRGIEVSRQLRTVSTTPSRQGGLCK